MNNTFFYILKYWLSDTHYSRVKFLHFHKKVSRWGITVCECTLHVLENWKRHRDSTKKFSFTNGIGESNAVGVYSFHDLFWVTSTALDSLVNIE